MGSRKSKKSTLGYWYYATIKAGLALKLDEIFQIKAGDKILSSARITQKQGNQSIYIDNPWLFGGEKGEGGIQGNLDIRWGDANQQPNNLLKGLIGEDIPADRGYVSTVFDGKLTALNPYPKTWAYDVRRYVSNFYPTKSAIILANGNIYAMNPAHILWESYTDEDWGSGLPVAAMDEVAFRAAADTLYEEGFGLCLAWKVTDELKSFRKQVCDHIGAKVFTSRNGLITIKLIRDNYSVDSLPVFDENNGLLKLNYDTTNNSTIPSKVVVTYKDAITFKDRPAMAVNLAVAQSQGNQSVQPLEYKGLPTGELADRVAHRELKIRTSSLKRYNLEFDRRAFELDIGDPFILRSSKRKVNTILRVERIEENFLTDATIKIAAMQDLYGLPKIAYNSIPPIEHSEPDDIPVVVEQFKLLEVPYRELTGLLDAANLELLDATTSFFFVVAASPKSACRNYNLASRSRGNSVFNIVEPAGVWCPTATITTELDYLTTTVTFIKGILLEEVEKGSAAIINDEIVRVDKIDLINNKITIARGCADTVPQKHLKGSTIWFYDSFETTDGIEYTSNLTVETKLLSNTYIGQLELSKAPSKTLKIMGRPARPYSPGNFRINGISYPEQIKGQSITISWSHRDRLLQADQLIDNTVNNIGPEPNTYYKIAIYRDNILYKNVKDITTNSYLFDASIMPPKKADSVLLQFNDFTDDSGKVWKTYGTPQIVEDEGAIANKCLRLTGDSFLTTDITEDLQFAKEDFTIEFWFKTGLKENSSHVLVDMMNLDSPDSSISIYAMDKNNIGVLVYKAYQSGEQGMTYGYPSGLNVSDNKWHHAAFVKYQGNILVFVDGNKKLTLTDKINYQFDPDRTKLAIGSNYSSYPNNTANNLDGLIDQVLITKKACYIENFIPDHNPHIYDDGKKTSITIELSAERDGLSSWQNHRHTFTLNSD